jgi:hypothetical protein
VGGEVFDGEVAADAVDPDEPDNGSVVAGLITAVAADVAAADPLRFVAVTMTRAVAPASAVERLYVCVRAPVIARQLAPLESQRSH